MILVSKDALQSWRRRTQSFWENTSSYLLLATCPSWNWYETLQEFTRAAMRTALIDMCVVPRHIISTCRELDLARSPSSIVVKISKDDMLVSVVRKKDISNESLYLSKEVFICCLVGRSFSIRRWRMKLWEMQPRVVSYGTRLCGKRHLSWMSYLRCTNSNERLG